MTGVLIKRGNLEIDTRTGRTPCEHEDGDPQGNETGLEDPSLAIQRRNKPCQPLDFERLASRAVSQFISNHSGFRCYCYSRPNKLI